MIEVTDGADEEKGTEENFLEIAQGLKKELEELKASKDKPAAVTIDGGNAQLIAELTKELRRGRIDNAYDSESNYVSEDEIDPEDHIEDGIMFFHHGAGYVIVDDKKSGRQIQTPFKNAIFFGYQSTKKIQVGKHIELHQLSSYTSYSKKEVKWLRESSYYGVMIFDNTNTAMKSNHKTAIKMANLMNRVSAMGNGKIIDACKSAKIPIVKDMEQMKMLLAAHYVDQQVEREESQNAKRVKEALVSGDTEEQMAKAALSVS